MINAVLGLVVVLLGAGKILASGPVSSRKRTRVGNHTRPDGARVAAYMRTSHAAGRPRGYLVLARWPACSCRVQSATGTLRSGAELADLRGWCRLRHALDLARGGPRLAWQLRLQRTRPRRGSHQHVIPLGDLAPARGWLSAAFLVESSTRGRARYRLMVAVRQDDDVRMVRLSKGAAALGVHRPSRPPAEALWVFATK